MNLQKKQPLEGSTLVSWGPTHLLLQEDNHISHNLEASFDQSKNVRTADIHKKPLFVLLDESMLTHMAYTQRQIE